MTTKTSTSVLEFQSTPSRATTSRNEPSEPIAPQDDLNRHARRRAKVFGPGRRIPLDRNAKARIMMRARGYLHRLADGSRKPKGRAYGLPRRQNNARLTRAANPEAVQPAPSAVRPSRNVKAPVPSG